MADDFDEDEEANGSGGGHDSPSPRPSRQQVRPPDEPKGSRDPLKGRGGNVIPLPGRLNSGAIRPRHDGFTPAKQRKFFKALQKCGCIRDACRAAGISKTTVDRWRDKDETFDDKVEATLALASVTLDTIAWKRATEGTEEKIYRDGRLVFTRVKPSDSILRLLMQGANPKKYGRTGQLPRPKNKHLMKKLKKQAEREVKAAYSEGNRQALEAKLIELLGMVERRSERKKLAEGWTPGPDGRLVVPPGWRMVPAVPLLPPPLSRA